MTIATMLEAPLRQRADYTHSHNRDLGRHGWLRLTPAYSVKVVEELLSSAPLSAVVLDPFCGTGTTALVASTLGHQAYTTEINPFLVWYARAKLDTYDDRDRIRARKLIEESILHVYRQGHAITTAPRIFNIERWWGAKELSFLLGIKATFSDFDTDPESRKAENLVRIAFCRTLIFLSNAAFNHQSMSFRGAISDRLPFSDKIDVFVEAFADAAKKVIAGSEKNPITEGKVILGDARNIDTLLREGIDLVITSPPYPNRMSYIRELRPYMYWLDFLSDAKEASELDWEAIGGTWGSATSRLNSWEPKNSGYASSVLETTVEKISNPANANGDLLGRYVSKYFHDTYAHFASLKEVLNSGATVHYVVGNSTFYGNLLPVEKLYAEIMSQNGFDRISVKSLRKRNSKKELVEFCVSASWEG